jgi:nucleotidyltransferase substrate binding protein (TIGR01987 family)
MERAIQESFQDFERILGQFAEVMGTPASDLDSRDRDSGILRFELCYEVCWKLLQRLVRDQGYESNGPRSAFEKAFALGWIENESVWYDLMKDRNTAVHVYREEWAEALFLRLNAYMEAFQALRDALACEFNF